jgi:hypothetical protein
VKNSIFTSWAKVDSEARSAMTRRKDFFEEGGRRKEEGEYIMLLFEGY